jgi:hypothetical protein
MFLKIRAVVEKPTDTQTSLTSQLALWLACLTPPDAGGHEFEFPARKNMLR